MEEVRMLPSGSYDAFYVQHPSGISMSPSHSRNTNGMRSYVANIMDGSSHSPNELSNPPHGLQQNPLYPTDGSASPWNGSNASSSKEPFMPHFAQSWSNGYSSITPMYPAYEETDGLEFGDHPSALSGALGTTSDNHNVLLGHYDLDVIGDDSGSGGMRRPKPKKRRKLSRSTPDKEKVDSFMFADDQQPSISSGADHRSLGFRIPESDTAGEIPDLADSVFEHQDDGTTNSSDANEHAEVGALHQGLDGTEDEPLYVNPKQYNRILKRREVRARMDEKRKRTEEAIRCGRIDVKKYANAKDVAARVASSEEGMGLVGDEKKTYQHESRHKHAMRRPRGPGGRFLTAEEIKAKEAAEREQGQQDLPSIEERHTSLSTDTQMPLLQRSADDDSVDAHTYDLLNLE